MIFFYEKTKFQRFRINQYQQSTWVQKVHETMTLQGRHKINGCVCIIVGITYKLLVFKGYIRAILKKISQTTFFYVVQYLATRYFQKFLLFLKIYQLISFGIKLQQGFGKFIYFSLTNITVTTTWQRGCVRFCKVYIFLAVRFSKVFKMLIVRFCKVFNVLKSCDIRAVLHYYYHMVWGQKANIIPEFFMCAIKQIDQICCLISRKHSLRGHSLTVGCS